MESFIDALSGAEEFLAPVPRNSGARVLLGRRDIRLLKGFQDFKIVRSNHWYRRLARYPPSQGFPGFQDWQIQSLVCTEKNFLAVIYSQKSQVQAKHLALGLGGVLCLNLSFPHLRVYRVADL